MTARAALTTNVVKRLDFRFSVTVNVDATPAPLAPFAVPFAAGFVPFADEVDVITEAALIVSVL